MTLCGPWRARPVRARISTSTHHQIGLPFIIREPERHASTTAWAPEGSGVVNVYVRAEGHNKVVIGGIAREGEEGAAAGMREGKKGRVCLAPNKRARELGRGGGSEEKVAVLVPKR